MTRRWTLRLAAGLAAGVALLSGCSAERQASDTLPSADARGSTTAAELPPLGPADLPMPAAARTQDAAGAEAFVRYYIDLINRTSTVMDAAPLREFSQGCEDCDRIAGSTEKAAAAGNDYEGGEILIRDIGDPLVTRSTAEMALRLDQSEFVVLDSSGVPTTGGLKPIANVLGAVALAWNADRDTWLVTQLTFG